MITKLSNDPIYNIKSVSEQTGIPPITLRAWERRYGFPEPHRKDSGYRLYTEYDIAALNWLRLQTESGLSIGQAVKLLTNLIEKGDNPLVKGLAIKEVADQGFQRVEQVQPALVSALIDLDEDEAHKIIQAAFNLFTVEQVLLEIIQPVLIEIGEKWHSGEISVATEHFATQHCRLYLIHALESTTDLEKNGRIVAACAPGEWHEMGILTLTTILRLRGWGVTYLGANLSLERFHESLAKLKPQLLLFSATKPEAALNLVSLIGVLDQLPDPKPIVGLGGQAFLNDPTLMNKIPGTFMGPNADDAVKQIEVLLSKK
ncbi:MAG: MerR family transcriptional regulator [Anaerolineae bacterium]|nr:MerR family transcriptional regulator [Anaerolineae bacterium]